MSENRIEKIEVNNRFKSLLEIFYVSSKLGLTSFGGPIAHLGYFHNEYVIKRKWLDEQSFADLIALCQFLPGPASSQAGFGIGILKGGLLGGIIAWIGFTLPSAIFLSLFTIFLKGFNIGDSGWLHGLKLVAVAIVAQAIFSMGQKFSGTKTTITITVIASSISLLYQSSITQLIIILLSGIIGYFLFNKTLIPELQDIKTPISRFQGLLSLTLFFLLLILLPIISELNPSRWLAIANNFYQTGALVFGGGHVVLPLLESKFVAGGWVSKDQFLAGYGVTQAVPGPLFTFSSYLGMIIDGWSGAIIGTISIFLPSLLLVVGVFPFWDSLRKKQNVQGCLKGINAGVVGILLAAFYNPIWLNSVTKPIDFVLVTILFTLFTFWEIPPIFVVIVGIIGGIAIY